MNGIWPELLPLVLYALVTGVTCCDKSHFFNGNFFFFLKIFVKILMGISFQRNLEAPSVSNKTLKTLLSISLPKSTQISDN